MPAYDARASRFEDIRSLANQVGLLAGSRCLLRVRRAAGIAGLRSTTGAAVRPQLAGTRNAHLLAGTTQQRAVFFVTKHRRRRTLVAERCPSVGPITARLSGSAARCDALVLRNIATQADIAMGIILRIGTAGLARRAADPGQLLSLRLDSRVHGSLLRRRCGLLLRGCNRTDLGSRDSHSYDEKNHEECWHNTPTSHERLRFTSLSTPPGCKFTRVGRRRRCTPAH